MNELELSFNKFIKSVKYEAEKKERDSKKLEMSLEKFIESIRCEVEDKKKKDSKGD